MFFDFVQISVPPDFCPLDHKNEKQNLPVSVCTHGAGGNGKHGQY